MRNILCLSLGLVLFTACASAPPPPPATSVAEPTSASVESCELVCAKPQVTITPSSTASSTPAPADVTEAAANNVDRVFAAMNDDLLACYKNRLKTDPRAHAFMTVDLVLDSDGRVRTVETTGGANLGDRGIRCLKDRIYKATFDPIPGGGTRRVQVPLTFRRIGANDSI